MRYIVCFYSELAHGDDHFESFVFAKDLLHAVKLGTDWVNCCSCYPCCGWYRVFECVNA